MTANGLARALDVVGSELPTVGLERRAQAQDGAERRPQVVGDQGEELVLLRLQVVGRGRVADDALEAHQPGVVIARHRADLEDAPYAVGPHDGELEEVGAFRWLADEGVELGRRVQRNDDLREPAALQPLGGTTEDDPQGGVGVLDPTLEIDFPDTAEGVLDDVLVAGPALLLLLDHGGPVALGQGVGQTIHGREDPGQQQRQGEPPVAAPFLGQLDRRLHHQVARDAQHDQQLRKGRARPGRARSDLLEVADQRLVDLGALTGDGENRLEPGPGLIDEARLLRQRPSPGLGEHGREDLERPSGHLVGAPVEGVEQALRVDALQRGVEDVARPVLGVSGEKGLEVDQGELRPAGAGAQRGQIAGFNE